jgi:hypothetical protein
VPRARRKPRRMLTATRPMTERLDRLRYWATASGRTLWPAARRWQPPRQGL